MLENNPIKVLLVEDNLLEKHLITHFLTHEAGNRVALDQVNSVQEACLLIRKKKYDVVFLDLILPDKRGLPTLEAVQNASRELPIVVLTSLDDEEMGARAVQQGAQDYLVKNRMDKWALNKVVQYAIERKKYEFALAKKDRDLAQAQKHESLGRLVNEIAHEFKNTLLVISGYSEFLENSINPRERNYGYVQEISMMTRCATDLVEQLLAFGRHQPLQPKMVDLNEVIANTKRMLQPLIRANIKWVFRPMLYECYVSVNPTQLQQVLINLVLNAQDAMPEGGILTIQSSRLDVGESYSSNPEDLSPGAYAYFSVSDSGKGITKEDQAQIFQPYFTRKEVGSGTGLGLAVSRDIVEQCGGTIMIKSEIHRGTNVTIFLPRVHGGLENMGVEQTLSKPA